MLLRKKQLKSNRKKEFFNQNDFCLNSYAIFNFLFILANKNITFKNHEVFLIKNQLKTIFLSKV